MAVSGNYTAIVQVKVSDTELQKQLKTVGSKTTINVKVNADTSQIEKLKTTVNSTSKEIKDYASSSSTASQANEQISASANKASKSTKSLGADFVDTTLKVAKFGASTAVIGVFYSAIQEAKEAIFDFNSVMTEFNKVSDLSGDSLDAYVDKLGELGEVTARSQTQMLEAATEFKKTGASEEDAAQLAQLATLYQNIADEQISASSSASLLTSQMKAFNFTADEAIIVLDAINETSANFAVSSSDISGALTKTSAALSATGNDFYQTIAMITAGTEIMTGQADTVGRGLSTIANRIAAAGEETGKISYEVGNVTKSINVLDEATGDLLPTFDILTKISKDWDNMSNAQQTALAIALAGQTRFNVFTSVMTNFDTALEAATVAQNSSGSAMRENEAYMESLAA